MLVRPRLSEAVLMKFRTPKPIVLLSAPAGYGKSVLFHQVRQDPATNSFDPRVISCRTETSTRILEQLHTAILGKNAVIAMGSECARETAVTTFLSQRAHPLLLVLEHYENWTSPETDHALRDFSRRHEQLKFLVLAQRVSLLDGPFLSDLVRTFHAEDLRFTPAEVQELATRSESEITPSISQELEEADGWPQLVAAILTAKPRHSARAMAERVLPLDSRREKHSTLERFTQDSLEVLDPDSIDVLLVTALVEKVSQNFIVNLVNGSASDANRIIIKLIERGLLTGAVHPNLVHYECHPAVVPSLQRLALRRYALPRRASLFRTSALELQLEEPVLAFKHYLQSGAYADAELLAVAHFTLLSESSEPLLPFLRTLDDSVLFSNPSLAGLRLYLSRDEDTASPQNLLSLFQTMREGTRAKLHTAAVANSPLANNYRVVLMTCERMSGNIRGALDISRQLNSLTSLPFNLGDGSPRASHQLDFSVDPAFLQELALTALLGGKLREAKRVWARMLEMTINQDSQAFSSRPAAWQLAALHGLAISAVSDGDFLHARSILNEIDDLEQQTGERAPGLTWLNGAIARVHLSYTQEDDEQFRRAMAEVEPVKGRIEQWPMLLMAELESTRCQRGTFWSISQMDSNIRAIKKENRPSGVWGGYLAIHRTMLHTTLGNFDVSRRILAKLPSENALAQLEEARLALFADESVLALTKAQRVSSAEMTSRQRVDRDLVTAVAAWECGQHVEAFGALDLAAKTIFRCELSMMVRGVPYGSLLELSLAARSAGVCDLTEIVSQVPEHLRCDKFETLTKMELRALQAMATYPSVNDAAEQFGIATATMKRQRLAVYRKLRVGSREQALLQATRMGLMSTDVDANHR